MANRTNNESPLDRMAGDLRSKAAPFLAEMVEAGTLPARGLAELAQLVRMLDECELTLTLNNGDFVALGFNTKIVDESGNVRHMRDWLYDHNLYDLEGMLARGKMMIEGYDPS